MSTKRYQIHRGAFLQKKLPKDIRGRLGLARDSGRAAVRDLRAGRRAVMCALLRSNTTVTWRTAMKTLAPRVPVWQLPLALSCVIFVGVYVSAALTMLLRSPPEYLVPMLTDLSSRRPERDILNATLILAVPSLIAICAATVAHAQHIPARPRTAYAFTAIIVTATACESHVWRVLSRATTARPLYTAIYAVWGVATLWLRRYQIAFRSHGGTSAVGLGAPHLSWAPPWVRSITRMLCTLCVSGQAVCAFKIAGLWATLESFAIAQRRVIRLVLLCTLSFTEYTAVLLFCVFLAVLAMDLRTARGNFGQPTLHPKFSDPAILLPRSYSNDEIPLISC